MFVFSKLFWLVVRPDNLILVILGIGVLMSFFPSRARLGKLLTVLALVSFACVSFLPVDHWVMGPLENRFPQVTSLPQRVDGILVLGGSIDSLVSESRSGPALNAAADRMTTAAILARRYPQARIVLSTGSGLVMSQEIKEAAFAATLLADLGVEESRMVMEAESRNTYENFRKSFEKVAPKPTDTWILVTSAFHMPRSMGIARKVGWNVIPYPVDYRTIPGSFHENRWGFGDSADNLNYGVKEWLGLIAYRLMGRTSELYPGPR